MVYSKIYPEVKESQKYQEKDNKIVCSHHILRGLIATNKKLN